MKTIKSRELIEAERIVKTKDANNFVGYAYAETKNTTLAALSVDGVCEMIKLGLYTKEPFINFGAIGGCSSDTESHALADTQQRYKQ